MINTRQFAKNSLIYVGFEALNKSLPFLLILVLSNYLAPFELGLMSQFTAIASIFSVFIGLSIHGAINVAYFREGPENIGNYIFNGFLILIGSATLMFLVLPLFVEQIEARTGLPGPWVYLAALACVGVFVTMVNLTLWQVQKKPLQYGIYQFLLLSVYFGSAVIAVVHFGMSWQGGALAYTASYGLFGLISLFLIFKRTRPKLEINYGYLSDALKFGVPLIPNVLAGWFFTGFNIILAYNVVGQSEAGIMAVALQFSLIVNAIALAVNKAYSPLVYEQLKSIDIPTRHQLVALTYKGFATLALLGVMVWGLGKVALAWVVPESYGAASELIGFLVIGSTFGAFYFLVSVYIFYEKRTLAISIVTLSAAALHVGLSVSLVPIMGLSGIAVSLMVVGIFRFAAIWILSAVIFPMPWLGGSNRSPS